MIKGVNLAFVYVRDMDAACAFYQDVVGLPEPAIKTPKWTEYAFELGGNFALHRSDTMDTEGAPPKGRFMICIETDNIHEAVQRMKDAGVEFVMELQDQKFYYLTSFKDMDGNEIRLQQYKR